MLPLAELKTWKEIKTRLKEKIKTKVSFEYAQEDLNKVAQKTDETVEEYGDRVKTKLRVVFESMATTINTDAERKLMRLCTEKLAVSKFTQNLKSNNILP